MTAADTVEEAPLRLPPALVVVIAEGPADPGEELADTLRSVQAQVDVRLGVVVVDTTADSVVDIDAVTSIIEEAVVRRAPGANWAEATNAVLRRPESLEFMLVCRSGVRLHDDAVAHLLTEALASSAGVAGPKLVDRDHPERLRSVGLGSDKFGHPMAAVEVGELDQEQHDGVADVYAVDTRCFLIRWELLRALGGLDEVIVSDGDDIDLGWRSLLAGSRVLVVPDAVAGVGPEPTPDRRARLRNQVRSMLSGYGWFRLVRVLPQALVLWVGKLVVAVVTLRFDRIRPLVTAWTANLRHPGGIRRRRAQVRQFRQAGDAELREYQLTGSAQVRQWIAARLAFGESSTAGVAARRRLDALTDAAVRNVLLTVLVAGVVFTFGSRHLLTGGVPAVGSLASFDDVGRPLLGEWWSGWWASGLGQGAGVPTGYGLAGAIGAITPWTDGLLRTVVLLGAIPLGAFGMARALAPMGSRRATTVAGVVYLALPLAYNALAGGHLAALIAYALAPWMLGQLANASSSGSFAGHAGLLSSTLALGLVAAVAAFFAPAVALLVVVIWIGLAVGSVVAGNVAGVGRAGLAAAGALVLATALHLPWSLVLLRNGGQWAPLGASGDTGVGPVSAVELLRFDTGPVAGTVLVWGLFAAGAYPLVLGQGWRLVWAIRAWFIAVSGWTLAWAAEWGALSVPLPAVEVALVVAGLGLAMAVGIGAAVFEVDLLRHDFGWRQLLVVLAGAGLLCGIFPAVGASLDGRWHTPRDDYEDLFASLFPPPEEAGAYRVLWIGADELLPARGWPLDEASSFALTDDGAAALGDQLVASLDGDTGRVGDAVRNAVAGRSNRLGRDLAPMGIRYVVLVERLAPAPFSTEGIEVGPATVDGLGEQLDLRRIEGVNQSLLFFENASWISTRAVVAPADGLPPPDQAEAVLRTTAGANRFTGPVEAGTDLHTATPRDQGWQLRIDGQSAARADGLGWENRFTLTTRGDGELRYRAPTTRRIALIAQLVGWVVVLGLLINRRRAWSRS